MSMSPSLLLRLRILAFLLPVLLALALALLNDYRHERDALDQRTLQTARALEQAVDAELLGAQRTLLGFAASLSDLEPSRLGAVYRDAQRLLDSTKLADAIVLTDADGQQWMNTLVAFGQPLPKTRNMARVRKLFETGQPAISGLVMGTVAKHPLLTIDVPVLRQGRIVYDLNMVIRPERLQAILESAAFPPGWIAAVQDADGVIVARLPDTQRYVGRHVTASMWAHINRDSEGIAEVESLDGVPITGVFHRSRETGYSVSVGISTALLRAEFWRSFGLVMAMGLAICLASLYMGWRFGSQILGSVRALSRAMAEAATGRSAPELPSRGPRELVDLAHQFDRLWRARQRADAALVDERQRLLDSQQQLARVLEGSNQGYWDWNLQTDVFTVSPRLEAMCGYAAGEMDTRVSHWDEHIEAGDLRLLMDSIQQHLAGHTSEHCAELRCRSKSGIWIWVRMQGKLVRRDAEGRPLMMSGTVTDITQAKQDELALREAATVFGNSYDGIMVVDLQGLVVRANPAFARITGYTAEEIVGRSPKLLASGRHDRAFYERMWASLHEQGFWRGEVWNRRKSGQVYAEMLSISVVRDAQQVPQHYLGVFSDISRLKEHEAELDRIAHYDPLTGVANRRLLLDRLKQALAHAHRSGRLLAVCFLDLDGFKPVNDRHGHEVGDQLLIQLTARMQATLREEDTIARIGGDEFVLLLGELGTVQECCAALQRLLDEISRPVQIQGLSVAVSASIGATLFPQDPADADTLLRHADQAMYRAKQAGKRRYQLYQDGEGGQA